MTIYGKCKSSPTLPQKSSVPLKKIKEEKTLGVKARPPLFVKSNNKKSKTFVERGAFPHMRKDEEKGFSYNPPKGKEMNQESLNIQKLRHVLHFHVGWKKAKEKETTIKG